MSFVYTPDTQWAQARVAKILRLSGFKEAEVERVEINCGNGVNYGWVVLKDGEKIEV